MSNKTLKQRIAVVAASALTAGFLSVAAMPAANAVDAQITVSAATGVVTLPAFSGGSTTGTGTITATGTVTVATAASTGTFTELRISGGTFTSVTSGATINADSTKAYQSASATSMVGVVAKPSGAGRNMVISSYTGSSATNAASATTAQYTLTVTVIAVGTNAVFSAGLSAIQILNTASTLTATSNADATNAHIINAGGFGVISYSLNDANNNALPSTALVYASIKSGACIIGDSSAVASGTFMVGTAPTDLLYVRQADQDNTPAQTCVAEVTVNGALAATKTFTFQGPVAAITATGLGIAESGGTRTGLGYVVATDSAGNQIGNVSVSGIILDSSKSGIVSAVSVAGNTTATAGLNGGTVPATVPQTVGWSCGSTVGTAPIAFRTSNGIGGFITSPTYNVTCAGNPVTYTASLDKASYVPGDIATLTVTGRGSKGELANDAFVIGSGSAGAIISLSGSQMTLVGAVGTDTLTNGVKTYKFVVGTTEGSYNMVVDIPSILTATNKATYAAAAQTVAYKVAGSGVVSNADVLKSIVSLIASINKQIQALQKLILRR